MPNTRAIIPSDAGQQVAIMPAGAGAHHKWTLDQAITAWLDAKMGRSQSARTRETYATTLASYRATLQLAGLDLDSPDVVSDDATDSPDDTATTLATLLQGWAKMRWAVTGKPLDATPVSASLHNQRLAIVSSFYAFAHKKGYKALRGVANPADRVDRATVQAYARAKSLVNDSKEKKDTYVKDRMGKIDRATLKGQRDYALLAVGLYTGRRLSEIQGMRRRDLSVSDGKVTVVFPHAKGGKVWQNVLNRPTSETLLAWLHAFYGVAGDVAQETPLETPKTLPDGMAADAPIWVSLARNFRHDSASAYGSQLSIQALADICHERLGTSKFHALRHTFAHQLEQRGAKVSDIQKALGHSSMATTGAYLSSLDDHARDNPQGDGLADDFGIVAPGGSPSRTRRAPTTRPLAPGAKDGRA